MWPTNQLPVFVNKIVLEPGSGFRLTSSVMAEITAHVPHECRWSHLLSASSDHLIRACLYGALSRPGLGNCILWPVNWPQFPRRCGPVSFSVLDTSVPHHISLALPFISSVTLGKTEFLCASVVSSVRWVNAHKELSDCSIKLTVVKNVGLNPSSVTYCDPRTSYFSLLRVFPHPL